MRTGRRALEAAVGVVLVGLFTAWLVLRNTGYLEENWGSSSLLSVLAWAVSLGALAGGLRLIARAIFPQRRLDSKTEVEL